MAYFIFLLFLLLTGYGLLIDYYRRQWNRIPEAVPTTVAGTGPVRVSVVVAVRNEAANLPRMIGSLENQSYDRDCYEIIVVDDHSTDNTWALLQQAAGIKAMRLGPDESTKKKAIEKGIQAASGELILTTDADCRVPATWITAMAGCHASTGASFIAAPVRMEAGRSLSGVFQCLDFLTMQGITGAAVNSGLHMMCNGANLAYTKKTFLAAGGFAGIDGIPSGDDMLLMHKICLLDPSGVHYLKAGAAVVATDAESSWTDFFHQRIRWASKSVHYQDRRLFYVLLLTYLVNAGLVILAVASVVNVDWLSFLALMLLAKIVIEFPFVQAVAVFFRQQALLKFFPLLQPLHIVYIVIAGWLGRFGSYRWKSRVIRNTAASVKD